MRTLLPSMILAWLLALTSNSAAQTTQPPADADDGSPWGGILSPWPTSTQTNVSKPHGQVTAFCETSSQDDPCVLTGQVDRYRTSVNGKESSLAGFSNSNFGLAYLYQINNPATGGGFHFEPVVAQPLYATNVSYGSGTYDMLIVASLNDWVYAFDTKANSSSNIVTPLWSLNLIPSASSTHCGVGSQAFYNKYNNLPGAQNLSYYGIVATPVIDNVSGQDPTLFVVSACTASGPNVKVIQWFLDAVDLTTGSIVSGSTQPITDTYFMPSNQISRASLLLTHPSMAGNSPYIYIAFGAGVKEIGKEDGTNDWQYEGVLFGYSYSYSSPAFTAISGSPFYTECFNTPSLCPTSVYPSGVYTQFYGSGYPAGPAGPSPNGDCTIPMTGTSNCSPGSSWGVNGGGLWQSSWGPSSTAAAMVYTASGNGAFACAGSSAPCLISSPVDYWGESAMQFPAGNSTTPPPMAPQDFFAPYELRYTCPYGTSCSANMPNNSTFTTDPLVTTSTTTHQVQELSRLDLDLGVGGDIILPHSVPGVASTYPFSMTSDKSSYLYVLPPAVGETGATSGGLGQFRSGDVGLTGSSLTYTTQTPFQINRRPSATYSNTTCETVDSTGAVGTVGCDEVHELAWMSTFNPSDDTFHDLMFVWPMGEAVEDFIGTFASGGYTNYSFGSVNFDPCPLTSGGFTSVNCIPGSLNMYDPPFPLSSSTGNSAGAPMALASNISNSSPSSNQATLWAIVPQANSAMPKPGNLGSLYGYSVTSNPNSSSFGSLGTAEIWHWNPVLVKGSTCTNTPDGITSWFPPSFTQPTLADNQQNSSSITGAVYVPAVCIIQDSGYSGYFSCEDAYLQGSTLLSGIPVFTTCH